jgi:hypothetical protein
LRHAASQRVPGRPNRPVFPGIVNENPPIVNIFQLFQKYLLKNGQNALDRPGLGYGIIKVEGNNRTIFP